MKAFSIVLIAILVGLLLAASAARADFMGTDSYRALPPEHLVAKTCDQMAPLNQPLALYDVVTRALCDNPQTRSSWVGALASADNLGVARSAYLPSVSGSLSGGYDAAHAPRTKNAYFHSSSASLGLGYLLYDFGQREIAIEETRQALLAANFNYDATLQATVLSAISAYFGYQATQEALKTAQDAHTYSDQSLAAVQLRYDNGLVAYADVLQAKAAQSQADLNLTQATDNLVTAHAALANAMGLTPDSEFTIAEYAHDKEKEHSFSVSVDEAMATAQAKRPDLAAAAAQVESAKLALQAKERENLPSISLSAGRGYGSSNPFHTPHDFSDNISLSVSIPFSIVGHSYGVHEAEEALDAQKFAYAKTEQDVALDVFRNWHTYTTALKSLDTAEEFLVSAEESRKVMLGRYKEGVGDFLSVLNAEAQYTAARQRYTETLYTLQTGRVALIKSMGILEGENLEKVTQAP